MNKKKNTQNLLKLQIFIFFSEALSMRNHIKSKLKNTYRTKEIIFKGKI